MKRTSAFVTTAFTLVLAGCAMQPEKPSQLSEAEERISALEENPAVSRHAPARLTEAQRALGTAQRLHEENAPAEAIEHYAYIADRKAQIAEAETRRALVRSSAEQVEQQRQMTLLQDRERELEQARQEAQQAREEAERLRRQAEEQLAELEPRQTERGVVLTLDEVLFGFDEATLEPGSVREVDRLAEFLQANPGYQILIEGHTDATGPEEYNQQLSERRAQAVQQALQERGVEAERIRSAGLGENFPVATNDTQQGRLQNRRVEVIVSQEGQPPARQEANVATGPEESAQQPQSPPDA